MDEIGDGSRAYRLFKFAAFHGAPKADVKLRSRNRRRDIPKFRFRFSAELCGDLFRRVNLQRKLIVRVEEFDEHRKSRCVSDLAKNRLAVARPKFVQSSITKRSI